jgi:hypothetical protein
MSLMRRGLGATLALATVMLLLAPVTIGLGTCPAPPGALSTVELLCDSGAITKCPDLPLVTYPHKNTTKCVAPAVAQGDAGTGACMLPLADLHAQAVRRRAVESVVPGRCRGWASQNLPSTSSWRSVNFAPLLLADPGRRHPGVRRCLVPLPGHSQLRAGRSPIAA